ncbi:MAG TPA: nitrilase-related carbon-nitrogen hydrolase [Melioribacteraceae bacterium]|nr:nitrilase-related carbon-nitrogen hydrolase [Melioribacteraceae bacterium]
MKIALVQQSACEDKNINIEKGVKAVRYAASMGAKIICFAELAFTQFYPQKKTADNFKNLAETIPGPTTKIFTDLAKELNVIIILNLYEIENGNTYDSSPVINVDGGILGTTRMIHITDYENFYEKGYYTPGDNGVKVYNTEFGKIGIAICYDRHYPEYMRALALAGAEIVFIPQAGSVGEWPDGLYEAELKVASFQNGYFTALCNRVGQEEKLIFAGESFVSNPHGKIIARAGSLTDEILICEIDLAEVENSHAKKLFFRDRRPELYSKWFSRIE